MHICITGGFTEPSGKSHYLADTVGLVPDHCNKANTTVKLVTQIFGFPVHMEVMFMLYCGL